MSFRMADIVARRSSFSANYANSTHKRYSSVIQFTVIKYHKLNIIASEIAKILFE